MKLHVTRPLPKTKSRLTITVKNPKNPLKPAPIFQVRGVSKKRYRRKRALRPYTRTDQMVYSPVFANKHVQYVAVLIGHGASRDIGSTGERIEYPLFKPNSDLVFITPNGMSGMIYGMPQDVFSHLCSRTQSLTGEPCTGAQLMNALQSTIRSEQDPHVKGQLFKTATLKQHDAGSRVSNLRIFRSGYTKNIHGIDGIYLFEVGKPCESPNNHNVLTVNPSLVKPELRYVAQTAINLQSFIEPTETHGMVVGTRVQNGIEEYVFNPPYKLKGTTEDIIHLSDVLEQPGFFPENTVVIAYVCRGIRSLQPQAYDSDRSSDYTTASSATSAMSISHAADADNADDDAIFNDLDYSDFISDADADADGDFNWTEFEGGTVKRTTRKKRRLVKGRSRRASTRARPRRARPVHQIK